MTVNESTLSLTGGVESENTILEIHNASVQFNMDRGTSNVLNDVNIDIVRNEILGVVGESGSGKSMFASALLDAVVEPGELSGEIIYYPDESEQINLLELSTEELRELRWEEIAMVFQGAMSSFNPTMTIRGHFEETLKAHGYGVTEGMEHARELLSDVYLEPDRVLDSYPHELSGGMQQRALIALSLILEPNVLVMDEPTAALDLLMQRSILSLLEEIQEKYDLTVVFITHDLPLVAGLADRLAVLYAFEFVEVGPARRVVERPTHPYTRSLLNSVPNLSIPLSEMASIQGSSPDPVNIPSGCSYHTRCPLATEECRAEDPEFFDVGGNQFSACFHWEDALEEIPLSTGASDEETVEIVGKQSKDPVVSLKNVDVHFEEESNGIFQFFGDAETVRAVDDANLEIYENDVVALVGESGCGKTTLGKTAVAAQRPTDGSVEYRGQDVWEAKEFRGDVEIPFRDIRRALQIIHQDPGSSLNPNQKIQTILEKPLKKWHSEMSTADRRGQIIDMLEYVGMTPPEDYAQRYPHQLSGGEKQRVALIRALLINPDVILADEAVSALDVSLRIEMMDLMLELQEMFDTSYLFISHNLSNARYFAGKAGGRIAVMYLGEIVEIGPVEQIINDPQHPYTKVLNWSTADLESSEKAEEPPIRGIDIPDPKDPPSGCRFHTRCPKARDVCKQESPALEAGEDTVHRTACFMQRDGDHPYWDSDPIAEPSKTESSTPLASADE